MMKIKIVCSDVISKSEGLWQTYPSKIVAAWLAIFRLGRKLNNPAYYTKALSLTQS